MGASTRRRTRRCRGTAAAEPSPGGVEAAELGVDGDRDPDLAAEGGAEGVLEPGAQPALELVAGELVGDRDDRGALVQGHRPAARPARPAGWAAGPRPARSRPCRAGSGPGSVGAGRRGGRRSGRPRGVLRFRSRQARPRGSAVWRVAVAVVGGTAAAWRADGRSTRLSTGCACCPDGWSRRSEAGRRLRRRPGISAGQRRFLGVAGRGAGAPARVVGTSTVGNLGTPRTLTSAATCGSSGCPQAAGVRVP